MSWHDHRGHHEGALSYIGRSSQELSFVFEPNWSDGKILGISSVRISGARHDNPFGDSDISELVITEDRYQLVKSLNKAGYGCDIRNIESVDAAFQKLINHVEKDDCVVSQRYYPNDVFLDNIGVGVCQLVKRENVASHIWYNMAFRPGTGLIINGVCLKTGIGLSYSDMEKLMLKKPDVSMMRHKLPYR